MIFIGDIAGQFDCLMRLVAKLPKERDILLLGDLMDRGPKSYQVIEWAKTTPGVESLYGNHDDMMIDQFKDLGIYEHNLWLEVNGGAHTVVSYGDAFPDHEEMEAKIMEHVAWLADRPLFKEGDDWIATHAPICPGLKFTDTLDIHHPIRMNMQDTVIWNRGGIKRQDKYQVYGHNGKLKLHQDEHGEFGACIDTSREKCLTALLWPEKTFVQEKY